MFRNPVYLDVQALLSVADYFGIDIAGDVQVTRRMMEDRRGRSGVSRPVQLLRDSESSEEITEVSAQPMRPVRAMNDVIDGLISTGDLIDLTANSEAAIHQRDIIQIVGDFSVSPVTEIGVLMASVIPAMVNQAASGRDMNDLDPALMAEMFMARPPAQGFLHVFEVDRGGSAARTFLLANPVHLFGSAEIDDLDGELTVMGTVDRVIGEGQSFSLERHLLPGLNRTARRAMRAEGVSGLLESLIECSIGG